MPRQVPTPRTVEIPSAEAVAKERERLQYKKKYNRTLRSTIYALLVVAALAVLVATIFLPVLAHELSEKVRSRTPRRDRGAAFA